MSVSSSPPEGLFLQLCRQLELRQSSDQTLQDLCAEQGISVFVLNRLFQKWTGQSPRAWQRRLRLNEAAILLGRTDRRVLDIAQTVGYESQQGFCRAFVRQHGMNPSEFRQEFWRTHGAPQPKSTRLAVAHRLLPSFTVISARFIGNYDEVPRFWQTFGARCRQWDIPLSEYQYLGLTWDDPAVTPAGQIRYDCAALPLSAATNWQGWREAASDLCQTPSGGGVYAVLAQQGRYIDAVPEGYRALVCDWLPGSGWQLDMRPALEWFDTPPWQMPADDWRFEIYLPIS